MPGLHVTKQLLSASLSNPFFTATAHPEANVYDPVAALATWQASTTHRACLEARRFNNKANFTRAAVTRT